MWTCIWADHQAEAQEPQSYTCFDGAGLLVMDAVLISCHSQEVLDFLLCESTLDTVHMPVWLAEVSHHKWGMQRLNLPPSVLWPGLSVHHCFNAVSIFGCGQDVGSTKQGRKTHPLDTEATYFCPSADADGHWRLVIVVMHVIMLQSMQLIHFLSSLCLVAAADNVQPCQPGRGPFPRHIH